MAALYQHVDKGVAVSKQHDARRKRTRGLISKANDMHALGVAGGADVYLVIVPRDPKRAAIAFQSDGDVLARARARKTHVLGPDDPLPKHMDE